MDDLRSDDGWLPSLSLVALLGDTVIGHVVCTRGHVADTPALGLGPLSVLPAHQSRGVGTALMHTMLGAADALDEPLVILLGNPAYYGRFGFRPASGLDITMPGPWGNDFQACALSAYDPTIRGTFRFADPFARL